MVPLGTLLYTNCLYLVLLVPGNIWLYYGTSDLAHRSTTLLLLLLKPLLSLQVLLKLLLLLLWTHRAMLNFLSVSSAQSPAIYRPLVEQGCILNTAEGFDGYKILALTLKKNV